MHNCASSLGNSQDLMQNFRYRGNYICVQLWTLKMLECPVHCICAWLQGICKLCPKSNVGTIMIVLSIAVVIFFPFAFKLGDIFSKIPSLSIGLNFAQVCRVWAQKLSMYSLKSCATLLPFSKTSWKLPWCHCTLPCMLKHMLETCMMRPSIAVCLWMLITA